MREQLSTALGLFMLGSAVALIPLMLVLGLVRMLVTDWLRCSRGLSLHPLNEPLIIG